MRQQAPPLDADAGNTVPTKALVPRKGRAVVVPAFVQPLLDMTEEHSLATWAAAYLQDNVAEMQALRMFEAKVRDPGAFVAWMAKVHGVAAITDYVAATSAFT